MGLDGEGEELDMDLETRGDEEGNEGFEDDECDRVGSSCKLP